MASNGRERNSSLSRRRAAAYLVGLGALFLVILRTDLSKSRKILGFYLRRGFVLAANRVVDFLAVDTDLLGSIDPQANLVSADVHNCHLDVVSDHYRFVSLTGQHQHVQAPSC